MPLSFAYGSNMDVAAMALRCSRAKFLGRAVLPRHRFALLPEGYATVLRDPAASVGGVLWDLSFADVAALDRYEEVARGGYVKMHHPVLREGAAPLRALIYVGVPGKMLGRAPPDYMTSIIAAAAGHGFSPDYLNVLRRLGGEDVVDARQKFRAIKNLPKTNPPKTNPSETNPSKTS